MPGCIATNLHEGVRSEYLAQFVFASFGTAVSVPQQEDSGLDLLCTLNDRVGRRSWSRIQFSVQVKSTDKPWVFEGVEAVRWLIQHPIPILFCIADKPELRLRVYHAFPRYHMWIVPPLPDRIELVPGDGHDGRCVEWAGDGTYSLSAPVLDFRLNDFCSDALFPSPREILDFWLRHDVENLRKVRNGLHQFTMPDYYHTNRLGSHGRVIQSRAKLDGDGLRSLQASLRDQLGYLAQQLWKSGDLSGAARAAILFQHLFPPTPPYSDHLDGFLCGKLNEVVSSSLPTYLYRGVDELGRVVDQALGDHKQPRGTVG